MWQSERSGRASRRGGTRALQARPSGHWMPRSAIKDLDAAPKVCGHAMMLDIVDGGPAD